MEAPLEEPIASQYAQAAAAWSKLFREFLAAEEVVAAKGSRAPSGVAHGTRGGMSSPTTLDGACAATAAYAGAQAAVCMALLDPRLYGLAFPPPAGVTEGEGGGRGGRRAADTRTTWRSFWAAHQAFFRHMTMAAKVRPSCSLSLPLHSWC